MPLISSVTSEILQRWREGNQPTSEEIQQLLTEELNISQRAKVFDINPSNGWKKIEARSHLFLTVYPEIIELSQKLRIEITANTFISLWVLWLPLAMQLAEARKELGRTLIQGILGGQGTGKTTLAEILRLILTHLGYSTLNLSLDDLYKTYKERQQLQQQDPRLIWRGPPGTHDVQLGIQLLDRCLERDKQEPILVPRFDKSASNGAGDRTKPEVIEKNVDIILFEGWFVGVTPIDEKAFDKAPSPILTIEDRSFARDMNEGLKEYLPLWERLDRLMVLYPVDYRYGKQWRKEAEHKAKALGKTGMSDAQIDEFVEYFWRSLHPELFITPLIHNPNLVDLVIEINCDRTFASIYC